MALQGPQVIIGLGNPGTDYKDTRHNAGFDVVDALAVELGVKYWKLISNALVGETSLHGEKILLIKPQSFMNLSGGPVKGVSGRYGFDANDILVIHDELDLVAGTLRLKFGGGHAGHKGLRSMSLSMGQDFARLRVGIGRPPGRMPAHSFVLQKMRVAELAEWRVLIAQAAIVARKTIEAGLRAAMNIYNVSEKEERKESAKEGVPKIAAENVQKNVQLNGRESTRKDTGERPSESTREIALKRIKVIALEQTEETGQNITEGEQP